MKNQFASRSGQAITITTAFALSLALRAEAAPPPPVSTNQPSAHALLERYAESQRVFRSFVLSFEMSSRTTGIWDGACHTTDPATFLELQNEIMKRWLNADHVT